MLHHWVTALLLQLLPSPLLQVSVRAVGATRVASSPDSIVRMQVMCRVESLD